jgi:hypothetical protein
MSLVILLFFLAYGIFQGTKAYGMPRLENYKIWNEEKE